MKTFFTVYNKWFLALLDSAIILLVLFVVLSAVASDKVAGLDILFVAVIYTSTFLVVAFSLRIYVASISHLGIDLLLRLSSASVAASIVLFILNALIDLNITFIIVGNIVYVYHFVDRWVPSGSERISILRTPANCEKNAYLWSWRISY